MSLPSHCETCGIPLKDVVLIQKGKVLTKELVTEGPPHYFCSDRCSADFLHARDAIEQENQTREDQRALLGFYNSTQLQHTASALAAAISIPTELALLHVIPIPVIVGLAAASLTLFFLSAYSYILWNTQIQQLLRQHYPSHDEFVKVQGRDDSYDSRNKLGLLDAFYMEKANPYILREAEEKKKPKEEHKKDWLNFRKWRKERSVPELVLLEFIVFALGLELAVIVQSVYR
jgi:hypothetical protein